MVDVLAVLASDLHFSHNAPVSRSVEPDWYAVMKRSIDEIKVVMSDHNAPLIVAGDFLDRWNCQNELVNFLLDNLPDCAGVPGQHDLPNHRYDERHRSAYGTLVRAGKIQDLLPDVATRIGGELVVYAFPWGFEIKPNEIDDGQFHLAVVHSYIWKEKFGYPGADDKQRVSRYRKSLEGYDAVVFGDNHQGFIVGRQSHRQMIMNCGTLMRRKIDEYNYRPQVGLLYSNGNIEPYFLDTSKDLFIEEPLARAKEEQELDVSRFLQELKELGSDSLDFRDAANKFMDGREVDEDVRSLVLESIG